jgi:cobalt-zinc-cadmium efflux system membrane fusion protein
MSRISAALLAVFCLAGCGPSVAPTDHETQEAHVEGALKLSPEQIASAGITLAKPLAGGAGAAIEAPALLESDPQATRIVAANVSGRVVSLMHNLGDAVTRGQTLAVIESREAAALHADVERARTRVQLAQSTKARDEALYAQGFRPLREVEISRAAAQDADVALDLARQQAAATGARSGSLNRILITAPISGRIIARTALLGQAFTEETQGAELFRIANLDRLNVALSLAADQAARVRIGDGVDVIAGERSQRATVRFISPVLDDQTRLVRVIAVLDNRAGQWRAGEPVQARLHSAQPAAGERSPLMIPAMAVQTVENRPVVFVRTADGFRAAPVTLGRRDGAQVAVMQGLSQDQQIAVENSFVLKAELGKGEAEHEH